MGLEAAGAEARGSTLPELLGSIWLLTSAQESLNYE